MKWRIVARLALFVAPLAVRALADGRVTREELEELLAGLLDALGPDVPVDRS